MIHIIFDRPAEDIKVFDAAGALVTKYRGEGDAWGYTSDNPYGHDGWCPPGHFVLGDVQRFDPPIASEGFGQIPVLDLPSSLAGELVHAGKAQWSGLNLVVGGLPARISRLAAYGRGGIMIHCGGSNAPQPLVDYQELCRTCGCTRMFNVDWRALATYLEQNAAGNTVVYTIVGDPVRLSS